MSRLYVKPAPGRTVPDPERAGYLPEAGEFVPRNAYWLRRIADKDVTEAEPPAASEPGEEVAPVATKPAAKPARKGSEA